MAMKAMKAMKALKAMKVKKAMKAMKKISARAAKLRVFKGKLGKTASGLKADDFTQDKRGKVVNPWRLALAMVMKETPLYAKGTPLYAKAKELMGKK